MRAVLLVVGLMSIGVTGLTGCSGDDPVASTDVDTDYGDGPARVRLTTTLGDIVVEMADEAPITTANFLSYVESGHFDGDDGNDPTIFHRVMDGFMIQGGGFTPDGDQKPTESPIVLEVDTGLKNLRGTIAMARTNNPDSATSQFFINHVDNAGLDSTGAGTGYAVFGEVIEGMDVVDAIAKTPVDTPGGNSPKPLTDVVIDDCERE